MGFHRSLAGLRLTVDLAPGHTPGSVVFESEAIIGVMRPQGQVVRLAKSDVVRIDEVQETRQ